MTVAAAAPTLREPLDPDRVERSAVEAGEPDFVRLSRRAAAERGAHLAWPTGQEEEWRRFPPARIPRAPLTAATAVQSFGVPERGVWAGDLSLAWRERGEILERVLDGGGTPDTHRVLTAVTDALWSSGAFVHAGPNARPHGPVVIEREWAAGEGACLDRTIVVAEAGSRVVVVEDVRSAPGPTRVAIPHVEVHAGEGAEVVYVRVSRYASEVWDIGAQWYGSRSSSRLAAYNVITGSGRTKMGIVSDILGDAAEVKLYGLIAAGADQRIDVNSLQLLDGRASQSDLLYLSALYEAAHATYYGVVRVQPTSHASGSYQECRNLLLSDKAGANPIPVLEILTNDVTRCGHGATAGKMDEEEIFYVLSRGIDRRTAEQLLVRGHFARVLDSIPDAAIRARVLDALRPRIGQAAETDVEVAA